MPDEVPIPPPLPQMSGASGPDLNLKIHPDLLNYYGPSGPTPDTSVLDQVRLLAMRGTMARAGAVRSGASAAPPTRYAIDPIDPQAAARYLACAFEYDTPKDGSVFWSGVDPSKLVKQVRNWNAASGNSARFGQLEATTDARFVNGAFKYDPSKPGANETFWKLASQKYGSGALGHVTAVQVFGLKEETIFWKDELPEILEGMDRKLRERKTPDVVSLTIVVIEPVGEQAPVKLYTNLDITKAPVYTPKPGFKYPTRREDCVKVRPVGQVKFPRSVRFYWGALGSIAPSEAAVKIASDPQAVRYGP